MVAYEGGDEVGSAVPTGFAGHVIIDEATVDFQAFEGDVLHTALFVVAVDDGHVGLCTTVADVAEGDILHTTAGSGAVLGIVTHLHVK